MEGSQSLVAAVDGVSHISATLAEAANSLTTLESSAKQITVIVNVIHDIADQTNLLALNAAIEAARAGRWDEVLPSWQTKCASSPSAPAFLPRKSAA
jgi:methyl-accepting chemotaxis protein